MDFAVLLSFILSFLNSGVGQLKLINKHIQSENKFMSASNINVNRNSARLICRPCEATFNTFHWLNWTPLDNWYALKIRSRNSEIEQRFSSNVSGIDVLLMVAYRERLNGIKRTAYITVQHFRTKCFLRQK